MFPSGQERADNWLTKATALFLQVMQILSVRKNILCNNNNQFTYINSIKALMQ